MGIQRSKDFRNGKIIKNTDWVLVKTINNNRAPYIPTYATLKGFKYSWKVFIQCFRLFSTPNLLYNLNIIFIKFKVQVKLWAPK